MTDRDPHRVEHELDPPDKADAHVELAHLEVHDDATLDDAWWDEPLDLPFRNYNDVPARPPYKVDLP
jgi:hypothetical protein